jgi:hypothetical protein
MQYGVIGIEVMAISATAQKIPLSARRLKNQPGRIGQYNVFHQRRQVLIQPDVG